MHSMTAFARTAQEHPWGELVWEIRSVNHRYLEPGFRLPDNTRYLEGRLREVLKKRLARGKVDCSLQLTLKTQQDQTLTIDQSLALGYIRASEALAEQMKNPAPVSALDVLQLPGVLADASVDAELLEQGVMAGFEACLAQLLETRAREGEALEGFLQSRLQGMSAHVQVLREVMPEILAAQREKLLARLQELAVEPDPGRLEQEMVMQAQKMDVDEELDRLEAHISEVTRVIGQQGVVGRRLDFLMQELNREANTLSSKSINTRSTLAAVDMKVLIEQMREQVQNIE